jgi:hypothetical protein
VLRSDLDNQELVLPMAYAPPIWWISKLLFEPTSALEQHEHFNKQTLRNRCAIRTLQGIRWLSVPVIRGAQKQFVYDVQISHAENWQRTHFRSLTTAYGNAPFFDYLEPELALFFKFKHKRLWDFNMHSLSLILDWLQVDFKFRLTRQYQKDVQEDYRDWIFPNPDLVSKNLQIPGRYTSLKDLKSISWISVLDLIFFEGPSAYDWLFKYYQSEYQDQKILPPQAPKPL